ncbi:hypothetical protein H6503_06325 [Candidatus Woesearchaeota archaeon]|nr:hypothetical protein [Candidatus Woesearchaeota archaeon]
MVGLDDIGGRSASAGPRLNSRGLDERLSYRDKLRPIREELLREMDADPNHQLNHILGNIRGEERERRLDNLIQQQMGVQQQRAFQQRMSQYNDAELVPYKDRVRRELSSLASNDPNKIRFDSYDPEKQQQVIDDNARRYRLEDEVARIQNEHVPNDLMQHQSQGYDERLSQDALSQDTLSQETSERRKIMIGRQLIGDVIEKHENEVRKELELHGSSDNIPELNLAEELGHFKPVGTTQPEFKQMLDSLQGDEKAKYIGENYLKFHERQEESRNSRLSTGEKVRDMSTDDLLDRLFQYLPDQRSYDSLGRSYSRLMRDEQSNIDEIIGEGAPMFFADARRHEIADRIVRYFADKSNLPRDRYLAEIGITEPYSKVLDDIVKDEKDLDVTNRDNSILNTMFTSEIDNTHLFGDVKKIYGELARSKIRKDRVRERISEKIGKRFEGDVSAGEALGRYIENIRRNEPEFDKTIF